MIALPGETVIGRNDRVYVDRRKIDDIPTEPFPPVHLRSKQYFVMGDNRSHSTDGRDFGPVPRAAIYSRAVLVVWPLNRFGVPAYDKSEIHRKISADRRHQVARVCGNVARTR